jgi:putative lipoprotein
MHGLMLVFALHLGPEHPGGDSWFGADKAKHFFTAAFVQTLSFGALRSTRLSPNASMAGATLVSSAASIGKELNDRASGSGFSLKDLTYDGAGIVGATVLLRRTER